MPSITSLSLGIDGRTFSLEQPGGDASVGVKHGQLLAERCDRTTVFGHPQARTRISSARFNSMGMRSESQLFGLFWEQMSLPVAGWREQIDTLYCPSSYCPLAPTPFNCIIAIQDIPSYYGFGNVVYRQFRQTVLPWMVNRADHIITVSEYTKQDIQTFLDVPADDITVVYNGLEETYLNSEPPQSSVDLPDEYLLFVGAKSKRKNLQGVIEAFTVLKREHNIPHKLVVVGPDANPTYDVLDPAESGLAGEIVVPDYLSTEALKYAYENASAFVFPSRHESFGLPPLEAAACRTPVVTSKRGAIPEILGNNAEFVDPEDSLDIAYGIKNVLEDTEYASSLVEDAEQRAQQFHWEDTITPLIGAIQSVGHAQT